MEAIEQLKIDLREERIDANRLIDLIFTLQQRIAELEKQVAGSGTAKVDEAYSMKAEEKRQEARGKKKPKQPHQQNGGGCASANDSDQRLAIAASVPSEVHAHDRAGGGAALD